MGCWKNKNGTHLTYLPCVETWNFQLSKIVFFFIFNIFCFYDFLSKVGVHVKIRFILKCFVCWVLGNKIQSQQARLSSTQAARNPQRCWSDRLLETAGLVPARGRGLCKGRAKDEKLSASFALVACYFGDRVQPRSSFRCPAFTRGNMSNCQQCGHVGDQQVCGMQRSKNRCRWEVKRFVVGERHARQASKSAHIFSRPGCRMFILSPSVTWCGAYLHDLCYNNNSSSSTRVQE